jgi:hypothetical protein
MAISKVLLETAVDTIWDNRTKGCLEGSNLLQAPVNSKQISNAIFSKNDLPKHRSNIDDFKPMKIYPALGNNRYETYITFDNLSVREFGKMRASTFNFGTKASSENETHAKDKATER